jgi:hypothetical protein
MSRQTQLQTTALLCLIATQVWLIYRVETALAPDARPIASNSNNDSSDNAFAASQGSNEQTILLAQMSSRLASLEAIRAPVVNASADTAPLVFSGPEAAAADRKLIAMLPKEPMTQEELMLFQAQFQQFPLEEQHQLSAALARAINSGRIQPKHQ